MISELKIVNEVIKLVNSLLGLFRDWRKGKTSPQDSSAKPSIVGRFIALFEAHGVHRNQIPMFFQHGLTLAIINDEKALLGALNDQVLADAATLFGIHPEWLYCATDTLYECHSFYKNPDEFEEYLKKIITRSGEQKVEAVVLKSEGMADENDGNALLLLLEVVGYVDRRPIHRVHLCHNWHTHYWKCLVDLLACLAIAETHKVYPRAHCVSYEWLGPILSGKALIGYDYEYEGELAIPDLRRWMITEMLNDPESFVSEMVKECGDNEILLGFKRWSDYLLRGTVALEQETAVQGYLQRIEAGMQALVANPDQVQDFKTMG